MAEKKVVRLKELIAGNEELFSNKVIVDTFFIPFVEDKKVLPEEIELNKKLIFKVNDELYVKNYVLEDDFSFYVAWQKERINFEMIKERNITFIDPFETVINYLKAKKEALAVFINTEPIMLFLAIDGKVEQVERLRIKCNSVDIFLPQFLVRFRTMGIENFIMVGFDTREDSLSWEELEPYYKKIVFEKPPLVNPVIVFLFAFIFIFTSYFLFSKAVEARKYQLIGLKKIKQNIPVAWHIVFNDNENQIKRFNEFLKEKNKFLPDPKVKEFMEFYKFLPKDAFLLEVKYEKEKLTIVGKVYNIADLIKLKNKYHDKFKVLDEKEMKFEVNI